MAPKRKPSKKALAKKAARQNQAKHAALTFDIPGRNAKGRKIEQKAGQGTRSVSGRRLSVDARMRVHGMDRATAEMDEAGTVLGRMLLARQVTDLEVRAGERYANDAMAFAWSRGIPIATPRALDWLGVHGRIDREIDPDRYREIAEGYSAGHAALERVSRAALLAVHEVAIRDEPACPVATKAGLAALVGHYRIVAQ